MNQLRLAWARRLFSINIPQAETTFRVGCLLFPYNFQPRALLQNVSGDSAGSRPRSRDDLARQSDLISLGVPSADPFSTQRISSCGEPSRSFTCQCGSSVTSNSG